MTVLVGLFLVGCSSGSEPNRSQSRAPISIVKKKSTPNNASQLYRRTTRLQARTNEEITDVEWDTVVSPSGGSVGLKDYGDYVVAEFSDTGSYVIRATALHEKQILGNDTITVDVE